MPAKPPPPPGRARSDALAGAIAERDEIIKRIKVDQEREMVLRKFISAQLFPKPTEGSNRIVRAGFEAVMTQRVDRKVMEAEYLALKPELIRKGVPVARCIETELKLVLKEYRALTDTQRKQLDRILLIKPSDTPKLDINTQ